MASENGDCEDGSDNDGDGQIDGIDTDCARPVTGIGASLDTVTLTTEFGNYFDGSCGTNRNNREAVFRWTPTSSGNYRITTAASGGNTLMWAREAAINGTELACNDNVSPTDLTSRIDVTVTAGRPVYIFVDNANDQPVTLSIGPR